MEPRAAAACASAERVATTAGGGGGAIVNAEEGDTVGHGCCEGAAMRGRWTVSESSAGAACVGVAGGSGGASLARWTWLPITAEGSPRRYGDQLRAARSVKEAGRRRQRICWQRDQEPVVSDER